MAIYFVISEQVTKCNLLFYNYFIWFEYLHCKSNVILGMNIKCCMLLICTLYVCMYGYNVRAYWICLTAESIKYEPALIVSVWEQNCN